MTISTLEEIEPFCDKNARALIERAWPTAKISAETQKERKAGSGQTLTGLGSYWKGRKPLILTRACILAILMPVIDNPKHGIRVFEKLMGIADESFGRRFQGSPSTFEKLFPDVAKDIATQQTYNWKMVDQDSEELAKKLLGKLPKHLNKVRQYLESLAEGKYPKGHPRKFVELFADWNTFVKVKHHKWKWRDDITVDKREQVIADAFAKMPYIERLNHVKRPEELNEAYLLRGIWDDVNDHLGTNASSITEVVEQLGIMRFGHCPKFADTFSGSGSIPYEAARIGCEVHASDLNPVACMLTWGAFNIVGASPKDHKRMQKRQDLVMKKIDRDITKMKIEHDANGNRAKVFLYCLETKCPRTGWMVPLAPSWVISKPKNIIARLVPDHENKRYDIDIITDASDDDMVKAAQGTVRKGLMSHPMLENSPEVSIKEIRGDYRDNKGKNKNRLRLWEKHDFMPRSDDIWQERLYAIQWLDGEDIKEGKANPRTCFAAPTQDDFDREERVRNIVAENLSEWQEQGLVPDMKIEPGAKTTELIRTRGWTHWHHLFNPRHLLLNATVAKYAKKNAQTCLGLASLVDRNARTSMWHSLREGVEKTFTNQALNTMLNYPARGVSYITSLFKLQTLGGQVNNADIVPSKANDFNLESDLFITDPPYADAVRYDEITEFFIAWLRKSPPKKFLKWKWDSRRALAIKGSGDDFRQGMVNAYRTMAEHMPDNGMQCVMFTHQDTDVWSDMVGIFWAAGLRVTAAWYIATETTSELKKGGYVQGTVVLVLRKRSVGEHSGFKQRISPAVRTEVETQIKSMMHLNDEMNDKHGEPIFNDSDLQMAGYAAALKVLTGYTHIGGEDVTGFALRPRKRGEKTVIDEIVQQASEEANNLLVPEGLESDTWSRLTGIQRFYFRMMDMETTGASKLDNYQNFAKAFRIADYTTVMSSMVANNAHLKRVTEFTSEYLADNTEIGPTWLGLLIIGLQQYLKEDEPAAVVRQIQESLPKFSEVRPLLIDMLLFIERKAPEKEVREAAEILGGRLKNMRALNQ